MELLSDDRTLDCKEDLAEEADDREETELEKLDADEFGQQQELLDPPLPEIGRAHV